MGKFEAIDDLCINTIRTLSIDMIQKANSGHPGLPLGAAPMMYVLWKNHLQFNPGEPEWADRDRFVLSAGHGSALLYSLLHLFGYALTLDDLKSFRQWESITPGHPESTHTPGVEATTGPLGQGSANAVGMAIAERALAYRFNKPGHTIVDHHTYALVSDGDIMEGICAEASSLAGHLKLGKLIFLYDANDISLDGPASLSFSTEDVAKRYEAYGWQVLHAANGDTDLDAIDKAITDAKADTSQPSIIIIKTTIGYGSPNKSGKSSAHGSPLGEEEVTLTKKALEWKYDETFFIPDDAANHLKTVIDKGKTLHAGWEKQYSTYSKEFPELHAEWESLAHSWFPGTSIIDYPMWEPGDKLATRQASNTILNAIGEKVGSIIGGTADLSISTLAHIKDGGVFNGQTGEGRNIYFGVREHAMAGLANGMAYHGGVRPFVSTFLIFSDYMRPSIRLAAMNKLPVIYIFSHDSIAVGEDGPTHEPVEQIMSLRMIPGLTVIRPADANETTEAWRWIMHHNGPVALILSRQKLPVIDEDRCAPADNLKHGAYILSNTDGTPDGIIITTGSEIHIALEAQAILAEEGIKARVVSMPCWEIFQGETQAYKESVLPPDITARVSVEAGITLGWERWIGSKGTPLGIAGYGASAPGDVVMEKYGFVPASIVRAMKLLLK